MVVDLGANYAIAQVNIWSGTGGDTSGLCSHTVDIYDGASTNGPLATVAGAATGWNVMFSASYGVHWQHVGSAVTRFIRLSVTQLGTCRANADLRARIIEFQVIPPLSPPRAMRMRVAVSCACLLLTPCGPS